ncbi:MAG: chemotaxis protein CheW [Phycisphaerae bacterium]|nr:chemotaxis protein CheW [Phycisphaerae bacterium]
MSTSVLTQKAPTTERVRSESRQPTSGFGGGGAVGAGGSVSQIVSFRLADEEYGVDIMRAQEIIMISQITRVPEVPDFICGLINLRGHVIPIVDLRKRFGLEAREYDEHTRVIVVNVESKTIGIVVDAVTEVLRIHAEQIEPAPSSITGLDHEYIRGLVKLEGKLLILLNIEKILSREQQRELTQLQVNAN